MWTPPNGLTTGPSLGSSCATDYKLNIWLGKFLVGRSMNTVDPVVMKDDDNVYRAEQNNSCMFEFPAFLLPTNLGQPMYIPTALTEHVTEISRIFLLNPAVFSAHGAFD